MSQSETTATDVALVPTPTGPTIDHSSYLGASDIGVIVEETHMARDESDVWGEKKGHLVFKPTTETELGNEFERPMLAVWAKIHRVELTFPGTMLHPGEQWAGATADAQIEARHAVVEGKVVGFQMRLAWGPEHLGVDGVPAAVVCQVHWQAWVLRANGVTVEVGIVVACFGTELRTYEFAIDDDLISTLVSMGREWWQRHIVGDVRPEGRRGVELVTAIHPANVRAELDPMTPVVEGYARAFDHARATVKTAEQAKGALGVMLRELVAAGTGFEGDGVKVTWAKNKAGARSLNVRVKEVSNG